MKCGMYKCSNEATHVVCLEGKDGLFYMNEVCEGCIKEEDRIGYKVLLVEETQFFQVEKSPADLKFRQGKRGDKMNPYGMFQNTYEDSIYLPCKIDPDYKEDFEWYFIQFVDMIVHEYLHDVLGYFINNEASRCLDNCICMDFDGAYIDEVECEHCWNKWKKERMEKEFKILDEISERTLQGNKLLKRHYAALHYSPYVWDKYWEIKYGKSKAEKEYEKRNSANRNL